MAFYDFYGFMQLHLTW